MSEHIYTYENPTSQRDLDKACKVLKQDGIIVYPTDVNWAVGCSVSSPKALDKIRKLKSAHPQEQPFSFLCDSLSMISQIATVEQHAFRLLSKALPGAYTYLLPRNKLLPKHIKDKRRVVGVRIPDRELLCALVKNLGEPLVTTSFSTLNSIKGALPEQLRFGYEIEESYGHVVDLILDLGKDKNYFL